MSFEATARTYDPYRKFKFLIFFGDKLVAGVSKVSALTQSIEVTDWRSGGDNNIGHKLPGLAKHEPVTLERGLSADPEFVNWMNRVNVYQAKGGVDGESIAAFRQNLRLDFFNLTNSKVMSIALFNAWPSKVTIMPELDATSNDVAVETLEIQYEGFEIKERPAPEDDR